jgi:hypothetical protein
VHKLIAMAAAVIALAGVLVGFTLTSPTQQQPAQALSGSSFDAGNIISDANFYDGAGMTSAQIQTFLQQKVGACSTTSTTCLATGRFSLGSHGADAMCKAVTGGTSLSAATIIAQVATACGIAPQVILVTLQKEEGLITSTAPSAYAIAHAMGYACPDTGNGCDPAYSGLGNQVFWSAWQWKRYGNPAGTSNYFTWYSPGATHAIQYNPATSCGTKSVAVKDAATAALYYYTPYTPNAAALANIGGTGDSCSAYGNRNFWVYYNNWFGSPTSSAVTTPAPSTAIGHFDTATASYGTITVGGWAADSTVATSTSVAVTVGTATSSVSAANNRADIARVYPKLGGLHGFTATVAAAPGQQSVCIVAKSVGTSATTSLGCKTVTVLDGSPFGSLDVVRSTTGGVSVQGWSIDPQTTGPVTVVIKVDGKTYRTVTASSSRPDVAKRYPADGAAHGYAETLPLAAGTHTVCAVARNVGAGSDTNLGTCTTLRVVGSAPTGALDTVTTTPTSLTVVGWAIDGDSTGAIPVDITVDGTSHRVTASTSRPDLARVFPAYGADHGYTATYSLPAGSHTVCVTGVNVGAGKTGTSFGCKTVSITDALPIGHLDAVSTSASGITVAGWAIDPDTTAPIAVHVYIDGKNRPTTANIARADIGRAYPGSGAAHGFSATYAAGAGTHSVCVYGIDSAGGANTAFGCRTVTVG